MMDRLECWSDNDGPGRMIGDNNEPGWSDNDGLGLIMER